MAGEVSSEQETGGGCGCLTILVVIAIIVAIGFGVAECHKTTFEQCIDQTAWFYERDSFLRLVPDAGERRMLLERACEIAIETGWRPD